MPIDIAHVELFVLVFIRVASALAVLPVFSHGAVTPMVKAALSAAIALLLVPTLTSGLPATSGTLPDFFLLAIRETLCGILLGFAGQFLFYAIDIGGQLIGFQAGFSIVASIDPNTETQSTVLTQVYNLTAILVFLAIDGHHTMLRAVADSFHSIPIGGLAVGSSLSEWTLNAAKTALADGIRLAAPIMVTLLLTDVGLGILVRVAPQMNIFVVGFPLKIGITLIMIGTTLGSVIAIFTAQYAEFGRQIPGFLRLLTTP
ncbi:flagellar biosynthetic protein FliR [bacterium]|nr:flagellar biosynthetic protein FliR [bacterium]MBU1983826.1 flagellar biosynthetic protein FliR [bacterium]